MSLEPAESVTLFAPDGEALEAVVERVDVGQITLVLAATAEPLSAGDASVEWATRRGAYRISGELIVDPARPDRVHLQRRVDDHVQRRDNVRVDTALPVTVTVTVPGDPPRTGESLTLNVSVGGLLLREPFPLGLGDLVELELELEPGAPRLKLEGSVVRRGGPHQVGIRFDAMARAVESRLLRHNAERQRAAIKVRDGR